jgi:N-acetyl-gamma-glutamyl-phosphate reductase
MSARPESAAITGKPLIFIDGQHGTIGLRIRELLAGRTDLDIIEVDPTRRKDPSARRELLNRADVSILCLPDDAAKEAVAWIENPRARVIDGSTAHRVDPRFVYGLPELAPEQRAELRSAARVANPGCWPTCVALLTRPLIDAGLLAPTTPICVHGLSGYSGGGKPMIERWESPETKLLELPFEAPYALDKKHKHVPEMMKYGALAVEPVFVPAVGPFRCGMRVEIPLHAALLRSGVTAALLHEALRARYAAEPFIEVAPHAAAVAGDERTLDPSAFNGSNRVRLHVAAHPSGHALLIAILDNLGKGASGAAVQNLNLMLGVPEDRGLTA